MPNPHEDLARFRKAVAIVASLRAAYARLNTDVPLAELAAGMSAAERDAVARAAGQRTPSAETWNIVVRLLRSADEEVAA